MSFHTLADNATTPKSPGNVNGGIAVVSLYISHCFPKKLKSNCNFKFLRNRRYNFLARNERQ